MPEEASQHDGLSEAERGSVALAEPPEETHVPDFIEGEITPEEQEKVTNALLAGVSKRYRIRPFDLISGQQKRSCYKPRRVASYMLRKYGRMPLEDIARIIGGTSVETARQSVNRVSKELRRDVDLQYDLLKIRDLLPPEHQHRITEDSVFDPVVLEASERGRTEDVSKSPITVEEIVLEVCRQCGVDDGKLLAKQRRRENQPLQVAVLLADELVDLSRTAIGKRLGDRFAASVKSLAERAQQTILADPEWSRHLREIRNTLLVRHGIPVETDDDEEGTEQNPLFDMLESPPRERDDLGPVEVVPGTPEAAELGLEAGAAVGRRRERKPGVASDKAEEPQEIADDAATEEEVLDEVAGPEEASDGTAEEGTLVEEEEILFGDDEDGAGEETVQEAIELPAEGTRDRYTDEAARRLIKAAREGKEGAEDELLTILHPKFKAILVAERLTSAQSSIRLTELRSDALAVARRFDLRTKRPVLEAVRGYRAERALRQEEQHEELKALVPEPLPEETDLARNVQGGSPEAAALLGQYGPMIDGIVALRAGDKLSEELQQTLRSAAEEQFLTAARYFHTSGNEHFGLWCAKSVNATLEKQVDDPEIAAQLEAAGTERTTAAETMPDGRAEPSEQPPAGEAPAVLPLEREQTSLPLGATAVLIDQRDSSVTRVRIKEVNGDVTRVTNIDVLVQGIMASPHVVCGTRSPVLVPVPALERMLKEPDFKELWLAQCHRGYNPDSVAKIEEGIERALADPVLLGSWEDYDTFVRDKA